MPEEIMTLKEVAEYLKLAEKTAYRLAAEGKITGAVLEKALTDPAMVAKIEQEFGRIPVTFGNVNAATVSTNAPTCTT